MPFIFNQGWIDHSNERSHSKMYVGEWQIVPVADADTIDDAIAAVNAMHTALAVVSLCNFTDGNLTLTATSDTPTVPGSENAQREQALWVQYVDANMNEYGTFTVPGVDRNLLAQINTDEVDIQSNVTALAFIAAVEANLVSRWGNPIEVTRMRIIGRAS